LTNVLKYFLFIYQAFDRFLATFALCYVVKYIIAACLTFTAFLQRLENGGTVVVAEGYIFEFERKGYLKAGTFVPEVTLEHPELVEQMYEEFVHAGSDVVLAFTVCVSLT